MREVLVGFHSQPLAQGDNSDYVLARLGISCFLFSQWRLYRGCWLYRDGDCCTRPYPRLAFLSPTCSHAAISVSLFWPYYCAIWTFYHLDLRNNSLIFSMST